MPCTAVLTVASACLPSTLHAPVPKAPLPGLLDALPSMPRTTALNAAPIRLPSTLLARSQHRPPRRSTPRPSTSSTMHAPPPSAPALNASRSPRPLRRCTPRPPFLTAALNTATSPSSMLHTPRPPRSMSCSLQ
ncbi:hypothetical protein PUNSTDRAFT_137517 [Punctularia strigosozonata HHB-11173 SS5]|uniref:uncharacterized protein n=1 Tax=Punctularia strigosozonata (strain HHB-11173) TaxID=741275 RepID=UPI0004416332|nr:uncharacterized protein PUNSTDRAFT_137517 [Punctularia strigosozonata HHB-11173 SS5]EIN05405.1 hypothetical protein PUNSTDRAFT_137517 [Punctularia strigosozonata HHB-11173 SS5]